MSISFILVVFLLQMAVGMVVTVALLPPKSVDPRFYESISFWALLFTIIGLFFLHRSEFHLPEVFGPVVVDGSLRRLGTILFYVFGASCLVFWFRRRFLGAGVATPEVTVLALIGLGALAVEALLFRPALPPAWAQTLLLTLNFFSAAMALGGFLAGMMFGHHYLVSTDMPRRLLVSMAWILIAIIAFRIASVGVTLWVSKAYIRPDTNFLDTLMSFQGHGIFFWQRVLVGLFIPAVVVGLIWGTARIGSNQSATGIMYVAIAFIFIGELAARYLFLLSGIPL